MICRDCVCISEIDICGLHVIRFLDCHCLHFFPLFYLLFPFFPLFSFFPLFPLLLSVKIFATTANSCHSHSNSNSSLCRTANQFSR